MFNSLSISHNVFFVPHLFHINRFGAECRDSFDFTAHLAMDGVRSRNQRSY